jgi:MoxR-like ATPase
MLELRVSYPSRDEEERIVVETTGEAARDVQPVLGAAELSELQRLVRRIPVSRQVVQSAVRLARSTRPNEADAVPLVNEYVAWGAGPRASQFLVLGAKAQAAMDGRPMADLDDLRHIALPVLRHRLVVNFAAEAAGRSAADICGELITDGRWMA